MSGPRPAAAILAALGVLAAGCGAAAGLPEGAPRAVVLQVLARGDNNVRGAADDAVAVRTRRRVTVVGARWRTVTAASTRTYLVPDVDGDGHSEVAAVRGREFEHQFAVLPSRGGRAVVVRRARWDVIDVEGRVGEDWLVVAADPDGRA